MDFERQQNIPPKTSKKSLYKVLIGSVLVHLVAGWWILSQERDHIDATVNEQFTPIKAKLIFFPPPNTNSDAQLENVEEPTAAPLPEELEAEELEVEKLEAEPEIVESDVLESQIIEPAPTELPPIEDSSEPVEAPQIVEPEIVETEIAEPEIVEAPEQQNDSDLQRNDLPPIDVPIQNETQSTSENPTETSTKGLAERHLEDYSAQANQRLAEQEAQRYREQQESPDLNLPKFDPYKTEDEKLRESNSVRVDCSSTVNKTFAVLSKFTGGGLDCSKPADFEKYIDKHVKKSNKTTDKR